MDKATLQARGLASMVATYADDGARPPPAPDPIPAAILADHTPARVEAAPDAIGEWRIMVGNVEVWRTERFTGRGEISLRLALLEDWRKGVWGEP